MESMSQVGKHLNAQMTKNRNDYKHLLKVKSVNKIIDFMKANNPMLSAFKTWKQDFQILNQKYKIQESEQEKEELRQQYELIDQ